MSKQAFVVVLCLVFITIPCAVGAHMLWLNASDYAPKAGESVSIEIGFGHHYPHDEALKEGRLERVYAVDKTGQEYSVEQVSTCTYRFMPPSDGLFRIIAVMKPGFVSKTTDGRKMGSKKEYANVVNCFAFRMVATALISVGSPRGDFGVSSKNPLEIVPLKNPALLKTGDEIPVKVMFQGKPVEGVSVQAANQEQSTAPGNEQGHAGQEHGAHQHWAQEVITNGDGIAVIKVTVGGPWLLATSHEVPYEDQMECDRYSYRTSLTVGF